MPAAPTAELRAEDPIATGSISRRWVHVGVAALAMVLTLPGRTHGLGLFTEPLLKSLGLDRQSYGFMNLWATLIGALLCLPCGWLLDRLGPRTVFLVVTAALGATVLAMSQLTTGSSSYPLNLSLPDWLGGGMSLIVMADLFIFLLLTRGLGQSALSVVSLALIGKSAGNRSGFAMGAYAFCTTAGFIGTFMVLGDVVKRFPNEWREPWAGIGIGVIVLGLIGGLLVKNRVLAEATPAENVDSASEASSTFGKAIRTPAFWTFSLATSFYGMVAAGTSLFNESILAERNFDKSVFVTVVRIGIPAGLAANLLFGWLATRFPLHRLIAIATLLLAATLYCFPFVTTETQVYAYAIFLAAAGGAITVCFFTVYRQAFGPRRLGSIQGLAQMLTVLASAVGPLIFASTQARLGAYAPLFSVLAGVALVLAAACFMFRLPVRQTSNAGAA